MLDISAPVISVVGPTASGKTTLAQLLALELNAEVVSADSMQIYRGMDIGTGKLPISERRVTHHGLDLVDPGEPFSAALYQRYARDCFVDIDMRGHRSILCGGTGFYVRAAIDDYNFPPGNQLDNPVRQRCRIVVEEQGSLALWQLLSQKDPASASLIPPADTKRVMRAFELLEEGLSYAEQKEKLAHLPQFVPAIFLGLAVDAQVLSSRIDERVDAMMQAGLVDEVKALLQGGFRSGLCAGQAIGYKEIVAALDNVITLDQAVCDIKTATHRYAKRQRTWFRRDKRIHWIDANTKDPALLLSRALHMLSSCEVGL